MLKNSNLLIIGSNSVHTYNYKELVKDYFNKVILITNNPDSKNSDEYYANFSFRKLNSIINTINQIQSIIKTEKPKIIHIHQANTIAYFALRASKQFNIPTIVTAWGSDILFTPRKNIFYKKLAQYALKNSAYFTSDSYYLASEMCKLANKNLDITIANFGINVQNITEKKENIIFSNRYLKSIYRIDYVINAFKLFCTKHNNWKLIIAGIGEEKEKLENMVKSYSLNDKVEFVGWLDSKKNTEYYQKAKIYMSIPETDATSISLLESMAYGCIPIVSNLPANLEWIIDGLNGVVADNLNAPIIEKAFEIDINKLQLINDFQIKNKATKEVNRGKFISLYERITKN